MDSILEDSVDENSLDDNLDDTISEMFTDEHALDYSSPPLWDDYDDDLFDHESDNDNVYDDPFDFKEELTISPNVEVSFFKLLCATDEIEDMTFDVYALPCYGLVLFVTALFIHALCYLLNDYDDVGKLKAKGYIGVFVGYSKGSIAFRVCNKRTRKIHESVNVNFDEISKMASKQFNLFNNFYDEYFDNSKIMKSSTTNITTSNEEISQSEEEVFHKVSESFPEESSSSSLNDDVQQSSVEVVTPSTKYSVGNK
ncbi:hypothetical protein Tco_0218464 [Tanacetum coccineum]